MNKYLLLPIVLAMAGCAVGPDYRQPEEKVATTFDNAIAKPDEPQRDFWRGFSDPLLDQLVDDALKANHDIRIAVANLREARGGQREAEGAAFPTIGSGATAGRTIVPTTQALGSRSDRTVSVYEAELDASWEVPFFGRSVRAIEAASANAEAAEASVRDAQVSVTAEVARNYFQLRGYQRQLAVALDGQSNQESNLKLVSDRLSVGRGTPLDTARARAQLETTRSNIPMFEALIERTRYRLAVLTGRPPSELSELVREPKPLPGLTPVNGIGTPESLLRRRPDIRVAERQLAASNANIGVVTADLFPHVTISGLLGLNSGRIGLLTNANSFIYNLGASVAWTVIDFGQRRARVEQSEARNDAALARYQRTVLTALEETEGALVQFNRTQRQVDSLYNAAQASQEAAGIARIRFENGATDFLTVLDAQRQLLADQNGLAQAQTAAGTSLVAVYKALGGGW